MIDRVAESVRSSGGGPAVSTSGISTVTGLAPGGANSNFGATFAGGTGGSGATTVRIVSLSRPQSIDQLPSAMADDANNFTTNMLTAAKKSANRAYHKSRHGR